MIVMIRLYQTSQYSFYLLAILIFKMLLNIGVYGDTHEPRVKPRTALEVGEVLEGLHKGILRGVLGIWGSSEHAHANGEHDRTVALVDDVECRLVARGKALDKGCIGPHPQ